MDMDVLIPALAVVSIFAICAVAVVKMARLRASRLANPETTERLAGTTERLGEVESAVHRLQQELAETQERLDFAERLLAQAREERKIGP
jgi:predicted  nucleic acid-binding Zn-ribbon protein